MGLIERILCKLFPHTDIMRDDTDDLYLRRFFIYPRNKDFGKNKLKPRIYLHKFYRGDEDPFLHDHPWAFTSLILTRGYWEETPFVRFDPKLTELQRNASLTYLDHETGEFRRKVFYPLFSVLRRPAEWKHRVILKDEKPVWTLVFTGVKERSWGFWIKGKLCPWRNYKNGVCWCEERADVTLRMVAAE